MKKLTCIFLAALAVLTACNPPAENPPEETSEITTFGTTTAVSETYAEEVTTVPITTVAEIKTVPETVTTEHPEFVPFKVDDREKYSWVEEYFLDEEDFTPLNPDTMSPEEIYKAGRTVQRGWYFCDYSKDLTTAMIKDGRTLYKVGDSLFSSEKSIYETLGKYFSKELIDRAFLNGFGQAYIAEDGTVWAPVIDGRGGHHYSCKFDVLEKTENRVIYLQKLYLDGIGDECYQGETVFILEKTDGAWRFTTLPEFDI